MLENKAFRSIKEHDMLAPGQKVLVAVSGGADSVALLHFLKNSGYRPVASHLNHGLRGEDAAGDQRYVRALCRAMNVPFITETSDVKKSAKNKKISIEEAGRLVRYAFFGRAAKKAGADKIALAHHADDNIETFLMRLLRGTGLRGLCGIPPVRGKIIRPFLGVFKKEILAYCRRNGLKYRVDASNMENRFTRNRIRNIVLPLMEKENPKIRKEIVSLIKGFCRDRALVDQYVSKVMKSALTRGSDGLRLKRKILMAAPAQLQGYILRGAIEDFKGDLTDISSVHVSDILSLAEGCVCLPGGIFVLADKNEFLITDKKRRTLKKSVYRCRLDIPGLVSVKAAGARIKASVMRPQGGIKRCPVSAAYIDISKIRGKSLVVRNPLPGDRFIPFGMKGLKKLQDFFVDIKLPRERRSLVPVVCDREKILWVAGLRADERGRVEGTSSKVLKLEILA